MTDLVQSLRRMAASHANDLALFLLLTQAADTIERLVADLEDSHGL